MPGGEFYTWTSPGQWDVGGNGCDFTCKEKDIDAVTISTPDHVHGPAAVFAMERGKHVYVQKPMTHNIREARLLTEMARKQKIVSQMGKEPKDLIE